jgi:hypothetical protein
MLPTEPATRPESYRQLSAAQGPTALLKTEVARRFLQQDAAEAGR